MHYSWYCNSCPVALSVLGERQLDQHHDMQCVVLQEHQSSFTRGLILLNTHTAQSLKTPFGSSGSALANHPTPVSEKPDTNSSTDTCTSEIILDHILQLIRSLLETKTKKKAALPARLPGQLPNQTTNPYVPATYQPKNQPTCATILQSNQKQAADTNQIFRAA